ncbi:MAG: hypothetical protein ACPL4K_00760, partial [Candidatus Margulisiibacteriota bacterium]
DLLSFRRENMEVQFWALIQEITSEPEISAILVEEDRYGTILLKNFGKLEQTFKQSIINFFAERKGKVDKEILIILDEEKEVSLPKEYGIIRIPPLRERKEDLPYLLVFYLKLFCEKFNKRIKGVAPDLLDYLLTYDYPGNYLELEKILEEGVLLSTSEILELKDISLDFDKICNFALEKALREGKEEQIEARRIFEKIFYQVLLDKTQNDLGATARFLDVPRSVLAQRLEDLSY